MMASLRANASVLVDGLDHPEGVAYDHARGILYAGGEAGQIYRVDPEAGTYEQITRTPGFVLGVAVDGRGRLVICDSTDGAIWAWDGSRAVRAIDQVAGRELMMPNYAAFAPDGTLYFTDSGAWNADRGAVLAVGPDGSGEVVSGQLARFPNGCAVTTDGSELWVLQSEGHDLHRIDLARGGKPERILSLPGTVPDGIAFTEDGGAVISCYRPDRIYYMDPDGRVEILIEDPQGTLLAAPTNVCFVGDERRRLVSANLGRWHLTSIDTTLTGAVPHAPAQWAIDADA
jgi:gluconolactonase